MSETVPNSRGGALVLVAGLVLTLAAAVWWLAYYGQWEGPFALLGRKAECFVGDGAGCANFRDFIGAGAVPVYTPVAAYVGLAVMAIGLFLAVRRGR